MPPVPAAGPGQGTATGARRFCAIERGLRRQESTTRAACDTEPLPDKAGRSVDPDQVKDVSNLADSEHGIVMGGEKMSGYWCEDEGDAESATKNLVELGVSSKTHVAYMDDQGIVRWER